MMRLVLLGLVLLAGTAHAQAPKPPAHYAKMFEKGREIIYDVTFTGWDGDKLQAMEKKGVDYFKLPSRQWPRKTDKMVIKCKVERVETFKTALVSEINCDQEPMMYVNISGIFFATKKGLYGGSLAEWPKKEEDLPEEKDEPLILAAPKAWMKDTKDAQFGGHYYMGVKAANGEWCRFEGSKDGYHGHNGDSQTCYGRGVVSSGSHDYGPELKIWKFRAR